MTQVFEEKIYDLNLFALVCSVNHKLNEYELYADVSEYVIRWWADRWTELPPWHGLLTVELLTILLSDYRTQQIDATTHLLGEKHGAGKLMINQ